MRICSKAQLTEITNKYRDDSLANNNTGKDEKNKQYYKICDVERRDGETAPNLWQRNRKSRCHPYFVASDSSNKFLILEDIS